MGGVGRTARHLPCREVRGPAASQVGSTAGRRGGRGSCPTSAPRCSGSRVEAGAGPSPPGAPHDEGRPGAATAGPLRPTRAGGAALRAGGARGVRDGHDRRGGGRGDERAQRRGAGSRGAAHEQRRRPAPGRGASRLRVSQRLPPPGQVTWRRPPRAGARRPPPAPRPADRTRRARRRRPARRPARPAAISEPASIDGPVDDRARRAPRRRAAARCRARRRPASTTTPGDSTDRTTSPAISVLGDTSASSNRAPASIRDGLRRPPRVSSGQDVSSRTKAGSSPSRSMCEAW